MHNSWLVAKHEYLETVKRRSFLFVTIGVPLFMLCFMGIMFFLILRKTSDKPVGYVDLAQILKPEGTITQTNEKESFVVFQSHNSEAEAQEALFAGTIQAYYVLPQDYRQSARVSLYYLDEEPSDLINTYFRVFIQENLVQTLPQKAQTRLLDGLHIKLRSADGRREFGQESTGNFIFSLGVAAFFYLAAMASSGYMVNAIAKEKETRMMEILLTTMSPKQIIQGKHLGLAGIALTQLLIWVSPIWVGLLLLTSRTQTPNNILKMPWEMIGITAVYFIPTYLLLTNILLAIGVSTDEQEQSAPLTSFLFIFFNLPLMFIPALFSNPNHPFFVFLTLLPTSTFITTVVRWSLTTIPPWQTLISWGLLVLTTAASVWISTRVFHVTMLSYGKACSLKEFRKLLNDRR